MAAPSPAAAAPPSLISTLLEGIWTWLKIIASNKLGFAGFIVLVFMLLLSFVGPYFVPLDTQTKIDRIYHPPSSEHWLGTDHQGRDIFSHVVHGGRGIIYVGFIAALVSTTIAISFGSLAAMIGGRFDSVVITITDVVLTVPNLPFLAVLSGLFRLESPTLVAVIFGLTGWPTLLRAIRAQILSLKERDFVEAAQALDLGTRHIIFSEMLPNIISYITVTFILGMVQAIYAVAALIILGLIPLPGNNWGSMISLAWVRGAIFFPDSVWYLMAPVTAISLFQLSAITFSRSLEQIFNPRLRVGE